MSGVVGLDLSLTSTGVAGIRPDGSAWTETVTSAGRRDDSLVDRADRLHQLRCAVVDHARGADHVVIESAAYSRGGGSTWDRAGLWWAVVDRLVLLQIPVSMCAPTTRAKWATGSGRADKAAVAAAVARLFPAVEISNADEADALVLAHIGAVRAGFQVPALARHCAESWSKVRWAVEEDS